ncbi:FAD-dependent oxidoreductase [Blastococcus tunisiensis]|uniref:2-polyprenyl-6-methoxyphenol hydroxylase n=1 Tax=Blastococcus tunisiensis TaxID=1798228 RepID=A0A1I2CS60_9ACTN|nr:FAD-dependent oxidoreductase [Blastococcus sp. DSM 46838]SFE71005.1 2-polyprenyl-6-methoxyphenol hydroxylase [Blastococcus sp. DSM 46838]
MATVVVLGAGMTGLTTAMLLARDGNRVTVLERDPAPPGDAVWTAWQRPGVSQFRHPHLVLPRWHREMEEALPEVVDELVASGGRPLNLIAMLPERVRGPLRDSDRQFDTVTARRPVLEAAVAAVAGRTAGLTVRRGAGVAGVSTGTGELPGVPHVTGVRLTDGGTVPADLVVDCTGGRSRLGSWLTAVGARRPAGERDTAGFVYYARHFRAPADRQPAVLTRPLQHYDSLSLLTLPADHGTWAVAIVTSSADRRLRALRDPAVWQSVLARYPLAAHWGSTTHGAEPITGVDVIAGLQDRSLRLVVDGDPVATGLVAVGDAWGTTNPALGRGLSIGLVHARVLQQLLREVDPVDAEKLARRFDEVTAAEVEPLHRMTVASDRHRLAELAGDLSGVPYETDDPGWAMTRALTAAAAVDTDAVRMGTSIGSLLATPGQLFADPAVAGRIMALGAGAPRYPMPGPDRAGLLAAMDG